ILDHLEHRVYRSYVLVDKVYVYRSPVSRQMPEASWIWHFDNLPYEVIKVLVYLTDVTAGTAPFEYVRHASTKRPLQGSPVAPFHGHSRMAAADVDAYLRRGYELHHVTGSQGTMLIFDENIVHRASLAREAHRDV